MPDRASAARPSPASGDRLDTELVRRGLARSRAQAVAAIADGRVRVDDRVAAKAAERVAPDAVLALEHADRYVSRSAGKLVAALDGFGVDPSGRLALDVGASTGGFTQVLLERGARQVIALDVGHDQLAAAVRDDDRVRVVEGMNARGLTPQLLASASGVAEAPTLVVADVSFIPLPMILPAVVASVDPGTDHVLLVKPQFEVGRQGVRDGVVRDRAARHDAVRGVLRAGWELGLGTAGVLSSPVVGGKGNQEYLVRLTRAGTHPTEWEQALEALP